MNNKIHFLKKGCTILGSFSTLPHIEIGQGIIETPAILLSYTDGLTDVTNKDGEFLEDDVLYDFTRQNAHLPAKEFNQQLLKKIEIFKQGRAYPDDFTVLTCKIFE